MAKPVYDALDVYSKFKIRTREGLKAENHTHKSYHEIMKIIDSFNKNTIDVNNQFDSLITSDMQLQDLGRGMEEGD